MAKFYVSALYEQEVFFEVEAKSAEGARRMMLNESPKLVEIDWQRGTLLGDIRVEEVKQK